MRSVGAMILTLFFLAPAAAWAADQVDLELVLLADASGSIDTEEVQFQRQGYASAITDPAVLSAILGGYNQRVALTFVEWAGEHSQEVVVPWTIVDGPDSAGAFAKALLATPRLAVGRNAIGNALAVAQGLIESNDIEGFRKVIDFSADSANSWSGVPIEAARSSVVSAGMTINGLAILCRDCPSGRPVRYDLEQAFVDRIIGGPGAFVITVEDRASFAEAVRRKLLLEIAGPSHAPSLQLADDSIEETRR